MYFSSMTRKQLFEQIKRKNSYLCIGLDTDKSKIPVHLLKNEDPIFEFNRQIIEATKEYCIAYKPNIPPPHGMLKSLARFPMARGRNRLRSLSLLISGF